MPSVARTAVSMHRHRKVSKPLCTAQCHVGQPQSIGLTHVTYCTTKSCTTPVRWSADVGKPFYMHLGAKTGDDWGLTEKKLDALHEPIGNIIYLCW